jgi:D-alanine-D-alanine ligase
VATALAACGHAPERLDMDLDTWERLRRGAFDCVFIALHGRLGEDGTVQGMLELLGIPYTGSGVLASALCIDKTRTNQLLAAEGLPVPEFEEVEEDDAEALAGRLGLPLVVKPVREGSTIGLTIAGDVDEVASGLLLARRYDRRVIAQRFVEGTEVTVGVLAAPELNVLPTLEITYENETYDYDATYTAGRSHHIIPARIPAPARRSVAEAAAGAFRLLGCEGMARVDFIVDGAGTPWLLEVNTVPGLTEVSLLPDAARAAGVGFDELCERLVREGIARHERRVGPL